MSESETGQTSIVFLGRESFRMQVVGGDAIPEPTWATKTARIVERRTIERRIAERRRSRPEIPVEAEGSLARRPAKNTIIAISLITFVSGALVATAVGRLRRHVATAPAAAPIEGARPAATPPAPVPPPQPAAPPAAAIVQPLPKAEPAPLPAIVPAAPVSFIEPHSMKRPAVAKSNAAPRAVAAAPRPRAPGSPAATARPTEATETELPAAKPTARAKWVDPFAD